MATKQLSSVGPRNFREKIELLKKKEAASTANFAAAIRDAREILQIAGACDTSHVKSRAVRGLLERSLSKSCSVPSITHSNVLSEASTESVVDNAHQNKFSSNDSSRGSNCSGLPCESTQVLTSNTNEHLMSLLSTSTTAASSVDEAQSTSNPKRWRVFPNSGLAFPNEHTSASHPYISALTRAPTQCSPSSNATGQHESGPIPSTFPYRRVQRYASGDQLPSVGFSSPSLIHASDISHQKREGFSFSVPLGAKAVTSSYVEDDPSLRSAPSVSHHVSTAGRGLHTAQTSLGPLHSSSPYCGTEVAGAYPRVYDTSGMQHTMMSTELGVPDERASPNASAFNLNIDWRRVSSDSSIHHSLMSYSTVMAEQRGYDCRTSSVPSEACTRSCLTSIPVKKPESLRRHFPTEPGVVCAATYNQSGRHSPNVLAAAVTSVPAVIPPSESLGEEHMLPAKRPFIGSNIESVNSTGPVHYSEMDNLSLNDLKASNKSERQIRTITIGNMNRATPAANFLPSNTDSVDPDSRNPSFIKLKSPDRSVGNTELSGDLTSMCGFDSGDLDRYLQIPAAFLDSEGGERWAGRRDSCTMTAEVLSALNAANVDSSLSSDRLKCDPRTGLISAPSKLSGHMDVSRASGGPSNYYGPALTVPLFDSGQMQPSDFQDVASKLGISMTPNDYQLLTNPQLANYVTDEITETQLLG